MRRPLWIVAAVLVAITLSGCSTNNGTEPTATPTQTSTITTSPGTPTATPTAPSTSPTKPASPSSSMNPALTSWVLNVQRSDAGDDVKSVKACHTKTPASKDCAKEVDGLGLSSQALLLQWSRLGDPPAEIADLVAKTRKAYTDAHEQSVSYLAACPDAGATSTECSTKLGQLTKAVGPPVLSAIKLWRPYIKQLTR